MASSLYLAVGLVVVVALAGALAVGLYFAFTSNKTFNETTKSLNSALEDIMNQDQQHVEETFDTMAPITREGFGGEEPMPAENGQESESKPVEADNTLATNQMPSECYPKDVLTSADLLPSDANSYYATVNPNGQGALSDQNFLTAGYHIGINTVGQTLRNANRQLRSDPPCPQVPVSPWNNTTIEYDGNRRPLEIGGSA